MKTRTGGAVPIMNQYDMCQLVQKWFLVCWDVHKFCGTGVLTDIMIGLLMGPVTTYWHTPTQGRPDLCSNVRVYTVEGGTL